MPSRQKKEKFQQLKELEWGRIIDFRGGGFFSSAIAARVQRNNSTVMRVWNQWTNKHQTTQKTGIWTASRFILGRCSLPVFQQTQVLFQLHNYDVLGTTVLIVISHFPTSVP